MAAAYSYSSCEAYLRAKGKLIDGPTRVYPREQRNWSMAEIKALVCRRFGVTEMEIVSDRRSRDIARPRQVAMYLCRHHTKKSIPQIGFFFGDRDHTTVIHAARQIASLRANDAELDEHVRALESILGAGGTAMVVNG